MKGEFPHTNKEMTLAKRLMEIELSQEQINVLNNAIQNGLGEQDILLLLRDGMTAEKMRDFIDLLA